MVATFLAGFLAVARFGAAFLVAVFFAVDFLVTDFLALLDAGRADFFLDATLAPSTLEVSLTSPAGSLLATLRGARYFSELIRVNWG